MKCGDRCLSTSARHKSSRSPTRLPQVSSKANLGDPHRRRSHCVGSLAQNRGGRRCQRYIGAPGCWEVGDGWRWVSAELAAHSNAKRATRLGVPRPAPRSARLEIHRGHRKPVCGNRPRRPQGSERFCVSPTPASARRPRQRRAHPRDARETHVHQGNEGRHHTTHVDRLPVLALRNVQGRHGHRLVGSRRSRRRGTTNTAPRT